MSGQAPQLLSRRGNHGRPRSANESAKGKGSENASNKGNKDKNPSDKASETTGKSDAPKPARTKQQVEGEKMVVRWLPPGMTETEFISILGPEWELSNGKVDYFRYAEGKVSKNPSKPDRPAVAYLHLIKKEDIQPLHEAVRTKTWEDAKNTFQSPALIGPPVVEFSIYKKIPSNKQRTDPRQGTIDQDPDFMAFLAQLANPTQPKDVEAEHDEFSKAEAKITSTPLTEYLKEKKANKNKDGSKKSKDGKAKGGSKDDDSSKKKGRSSKEEKSKPKETVKILTKKAASEQAAETAKSTTGQTSTASTAEAPKSRRAGIAAAARILQRDLGLSPGSAHRRARQDAAKADAEAKTDGKLAPVKEEAAVGTSSDRPASPAPSDAGSQTSKATASTKNQPGRRNRGGKNVDKGKATESASTPAPAAANPPVILKKKPEGENDQSTAAAPEVANKENAEQVNSSKPAQNTPKTQGNKSQGQKKPAPSGPDATRAFVKHVNASQGINDATLKEALEAFGAITSVDVDKRKGFAFVDFAEHDGFAKAMAASPVSIGQGSVQVLERKEKKPANQSVGGSSGASGSGEKSEKNEKSSSGRGRRGRGGGKNAASDKGQAAAPPAGNGGDVS